jgi:hypothetical protein
MISYLYTLDYDDETHSTAFSLHGNPDETSSPAAEALGMNRKVKGQPALFSSIRVYAIAEKYNIGGLKSLAQERLSAWVKLNWNHDEFPAMVREAYDSTPSSDRGLRGIIARVLAEHAEDTVNDNKFKDLLSDLSELSLSVLRITVVALNRMREEREIVEELIKQKMGPLVAETRLCSVCDYDQRSFFLSGTKLSTICGECGHVTTRE